MVIGSMPSRDFNYNRRKLSCLEVGIAYGGNSLKFSLVKKPFLLPTFKGLIIVHRAEAVAVPILASPRLLPR